VSSSSRHLYFRPDIEGLRAVAILFVVLFHAGWGATRSGFLGVDVFFVLSGFLITGLLLDEVAVTGRVSLTRFWARRARRLLPAAALVTLVTLVVGAVVLIPLEQRSLAESARAFALYGSNILFASRSLDYFGRPAARDPLLHTWSLSVEEQFYLFFAPAMLVMAVWARRRGIEAFTRRFTLIVALGTVASFAGCLLLGERYPVIAFYALPARAWEVGLGAVAVLYARPIATRLAAGTLETLSFAGMAMLLLSARLPVPSTPAPGFLTLVPTLGTVAVLVAGAGARQTFVARALSAGPVRLLGRLSYSWYLWHWPALVFLNELVGDPSLRLSFVVAVAALLPAAAAYVLVESPIRFSPRFTLRPVASVAGAAVLALLLVTVAQGVLFRADATLTSPRYASIAEAKALPRVYADGCLLEPPEEVSPECEYGAVRGDTTLVLFGDSHAAQWFPAMESVATTRRWRLVILTKVACPIPAVIVVNGQLGRRYVECERWRDRAIARIVAMRPAIVVMASVRSYNVLVGGETQRTDASATARDAWRDGWRQSLTRIARSGSRLLLLQDTPRLNFDAPRCLSKNIDAPGRCSVNAARAIDTSIASAERAAVDSTPGVVYVNLNAWICDSVCVATRDGVVRYHDSNHLSVLFARSLSTPVSTSLDRLLSHHF